MTHLLFDDRVLPLGSHVALDEPGNPEAVLGYIDPPLPAVQVAKAGLLVATQNPDLGDVDLEVWAGDPGVGSQPEWRTLFDGTVETVANGFQVGSAFGAVYHVDAAPGSYRVRVEVRGDGPTNVDGVRFVFVEDASLSGEPAGS